MALLIENFKKINIMKAVNFFLFFQIFFGFLLSCFGQTTEWKKDIGAGLYAPPEMYIKDHCLIFKKGKWHLFAPLGSVGTMWHYEGSEESAEHMVSKDLMHWKYRHSGAIGQTRRLF